MKNIILTVFCLVSGVVMSQQEARLLRFPAVSINKIVFSYAGDLYSVSTTGGVARKLTSHIGYEMFPHFSPDGKWLAFTAQYDGNTEVYVMPSEGGEPKRLTFTSTLGRDDISDRMGPNNIVTSWTNDSKKIIYRSRKQSWNSFIGQLFQVPIDGGMSEQLPLPEGGFNSFSADGKKLAFNRVMREFRTWKYYKGGMADDIWIYDFDTKKTENITKNIYQDIFPMWVNNEIYFCSDRNRTMNLFSYNITSKETKKVTNFTEYDVKFPSLGDNKIVFENGGFIYLFDVKTQAQSKVNIIINDDNLQGRNQLKDASKYINDYGISPDGSRMIFSARGDLWSVPAKQGITKNLSQSSGIHERSSAWSPDGKWIAFLSDVTGEYEVYIQKADGTAVPVQLTKNADTYKFSVLWSPDCKKILFNDKKFRLQYVNVDSKTVTLVNQSKTWEITDFSWSPNSKWIAFSDRTLTSTMSQISLYNISSKSISTVTDTWYNSSQPYFSTDGKYLFFISDRDFNPTYSETEWNHSYSDMSRIYLITLQKSIPNPLGPTNDEVDMNPQSDKKTDDKIIVPDVKIDLDGIQQRIAAFPIKAGNYWNISQVDDKLFYQYSSKEEPENIIKFFNLKEKKDTSLGQSDNYEITANKKKMLVKKENKYFVIEIPSTEIKTNKPVELSNMNVLIDNKAEWEQIYDEAWRQMRDFFYDPNMHGVDWKKMHDKYSVLLPYVSNRNDLNYLIGELIGELNIGHTYTGGGDKPAPEKVYTGLLGAKISKDASGYFKIDKILEGQNWDKNLRSPLTEVGLNIKEGEFITAINGKSVKDVADIYTLLWNTAEKEVELTISPVANEASARKVIVIPVKDENPLYYYNWVQENIKKVNKSTNEQVGYVHIPDMGVEGLNEFAKYFYPQLAKKALIIDDRGNGGGNVSPMIIERLRRELAFMGMARNQTEGNTIPEQMLLGPKVLLVNNYSASDGDLFPFQFRKTGLGKIIGVRTWGGVVGIRGSLPFIDGGFLTKPEFAHYATDGSNWIIEGHGVEPDIIIDNDPAKEFAGEDEQLNKAIEVIMQELKDKPREKGKIPAFPDKSK
ncbi:MAG: protease [Bacteroidetes bacterium CG23_combo_of_CG06-09_8_20_14_all_32_9]|nr:MAG: protease [Bacteroidetes bacterium CG23_combo_of_CG06-09_8_20_14_all_32_9]